MAVFLPKMQPFWSQYWSLFLSLKSGRLCVGLIDFRKVEHFEIQHGSGHELMSIASSSCMGCFGSNSHTLNEWLILWRDTTRIKMVVVTYFPFQFKDSWLVSHTTKDAYARKFSFLVGEFPRNQREKNRNLFSLPWLPAFITAFFFVSKQSLNSWFPQSAGWHGHSHHLATLRNEEVGIFSQAKMHSHFSSFHRVFDW